MEHKSSSIQKTILLMRFSSLLILVIITSPNSLTAYSLEVDEETKTQISPTSPPPTATPANLLTFADQRLAVVYPIIQAFKATITSDPLGITKTWVGSDICSYAGFHCGATPDNASATAVASVDFNGFGLSAPSLDGFLDSLPDLALFHANSNNFAGLLSPKIATLRHLFELDISNNKFSGAFPAALLAGKSLSFLDIRFNAFAGTVPPGIFFAGSDFLFLNDNNFALALPETLGQSTASYLTLANNILTGPIPRSIGGAAETLVELLLLNNAVSGCVPYELGLLKKAVLIDAERNLITGPLPCSLKCLERIEVLNFAGNLLYGKVPEAACGIGSLANFSLSGNYFTSVGPTCRKMISDGILDVKRNCIPGFPDQRPDLECALFFVNPPRCANNSPSSFTAVPCDQKPRKVQRSPPVMRRRAQTKLVSYAALSRRRLTIQ